MKRFIITFFIVACSWTSLQANPVPILPVPIPNHIQAICAKAPKPDLCVAKINADPRTELKSTPEGVATILYDDAKATVPETIKFIEDNIHNVKQPDVKDQMKGCLQAYKKVGQKMKLKTSKLGKPEGRSDAVDSLSTAEQDISYDCEWETLKYRPPVVNEMVQRVTSLSDSLDAVTNILSSP